jgi:hypothetical protein
VDGRAGAVEVPGDRRRGRVELDADEAGAVGGEAEEIPGAESR